MIPKIWRLGENTGDDNLGLACTEQGLVLGRTLLIERRDGRFVVRERSEIECLFSLAYGREATAQRLMPGLATVASALNANDQGLARIAAVHLRIPDLPDKAARDAMEAADILIKSADWNPALHPRAGTPPNPGWFAPTDGASSESFSTRTAQNDDPTHRSDASPNAGDNWVRLRPGPKRIDELADFIEWMANAKPEDEQAIRAEIKRYFYDVGDQGSAAALNSALMVLLRPGITREERQRILDRQLDVFTRADPGAYAQTRDWATDAALLAGGVPPIAAGEIAAAEQASEAWTYGWARRGQYFDQLLRDGSLPALFRTIDNFTDGVATSIKSIDLNAATYQDAARLTYRLNDYIDELGDYEGGRLLTTTVELPDISDRVLNLVVPMGAMTEVQRAAIEAAGARALIANRYPVKIIITPL
jgi:contact-dependent growth inhibition (CDI) system restriction endonuclease-like protein